MSELATRLVVRIIAWVIRLVGWTWRVELRGPNPLDWREGRGILTAVWHRNLLLGSYVFRDAGVHVPISLSRDGCHVAALAVRLGFADPPRGSSSRAQVSLVKDLVRRARAGAVITVLTDGPRGPARVSKSGITHVARMTGVPLIPIAFSASPCFQLGSWDGMLLPPPFARVVCHFGEPVEVTDLPDERFDDEAPRRLDAVLNRMTDALDADVGLAARVEPL
jgi:lysophospholipid acyltransferase (LPLAT)-like uncharacterized protein